MLAFVPYLRLPCQNVRKANTGRARVNFGLPAASRPQSTRFVEVASPSIRGLGPLGRMEERAKRASDRPIIGVFNLDRGRSGGASRGELLIELAVRDVYSAAERKPIGETVGERGLEARDRKEILRNERPADPADIYSARRPTFSSHLCEL